VAIIAVDTDVGAVVEADADDDAVVVAAGNP